MCREALSGLSISCVGVVAPRARAVLSGCFQAAMRSRRAERAGYRASCGPTPDRPRSRAPWPRARSRGRVQVSGLGAAMDVAVLCSLCLGKR
eukprot:6202733-Pleurochrysis_carterae.AAC.1